MYRPLSRLACSTLDGSLDESVIRKIRTVALHDLQQHCQVSKVTLITRFKVLVATHICVKQVKLIAGDKGAEERSTVNTCFSMLFMTSSNLTGVNWPCCWPWLLTKLLKSSCQQSEMLSSSIQMLGSPSMWAVN